MNSHTSDSQSYLSGSARIRPCTSAQPPKALPGILHPCPDPCTPAQPCPTSNILDQPHTLLHTLHPSQGLQDTASQHPTWPLSLLQLHLSPEA